MYTFLKISNDGEQKQKQQNKRSKSKFTSDDDNHTSEVRIKYFPLQHDLLIKQKILTYFQSTTRLEILKLQFL